MTTAFLAYIVGGVSGAAAVLWGQFLARPTPTDPDLMQRIERAGWSPDQDPPAVWTGNLKPEEFGLMTTLGYFQLPVLVPRGKVLEVRVGRDGRGLARLRSLDR